MLATFNETKKKKLKANEIRNWECNCFVIWISFFLHTSYRIIVLLQYFALLKEKFAMIFDMHKRTMKIIQYFVNFYNCLFSMNDPQCFRANTCLELLAEHFVQQNLRLQLLRMDCWLHVKSLRNLLVPCSNLTFDQVVRSGKMDQIRREIIKKTLPSSLLTLNVVSWVYAFGSNGGRLLISGSAQGCNWPEANTA